MSSSEQHAPEGAAERSPLDGAPKPNYLLHLGLFALTCVTAAKAGAELVHGPTKISWLDPATLFLRLPDGWPFVVSLLGILLAHEMGHYVVAHRRGVAASLPFFIPMPFGLIGTLGAVISMPLSRDRNKLVDIGAAGPLAGLVVAIPVLAYGLALSPVMPQGPGILEGNSLLYLGLKLLIKGQILPGGGLDVQLHPVAWAGWVGLLITMINLIPVGQLDGGHIAFAYFGARHNRASLWLHRALLPLGASAYGYTVIEQMTRGIGWRVAAVTSINVGVTWVVWWLMLRVLRGLSGGIYHPPVDEIPLTRGRKRLCVGMLMLFAVLFMPIPLRLYLTKAAVAAGG